MRQKKEETRPHAPYSQPGFYPVTFDVYDPMGSYTGRPSNPEEPPVQDADDL